jgi:predicted esterase
MKTITCFILLVLVTQTLSCNAQQSPEPPVADALGRVIANEDIYGTFYAYVPTDVSPQSSLLVLVHGTPSAEQTAEQSAQDFIAAWQDFAAEQGWILIAPAFSQEDFSSRLGDHAFGGYRGLFGREINADAWVLRLVQAYLKTYQLTDQQFYLYGHSAGGQFTARFLVTHPEHVKRAVISAAATYPQPDPEVPWPFGMGDLEADIEWDDETTTQVKIVPDKQKWLAATQVPLTVIVGLNDTGELPAYPGQKGRNRFVIGRSWVGDMAKFAQENGLESQIQFAMIPGKGHTMTGLLPYTQDALISP